MSKLELTPIALDEANAFVVQHHRHHGKVQGHKFSLAASVDGRVVGVAIVGRPVARGNDDGLTLEVTRLCTDGTRNACSFLYGAATKAALALGYKRVGTYILASENGASLRASNWRLLHTVKATPWNHASRPRVDKHPIEPKLYFQTGDYR